MPEKDELCTSFAAQTEANTVRAYTNLLQASRTQGIQRRVDRSRADNVALLTNVRFVRE